ncbi:IS200/IS605 family transposase [Rosenbergiella nectarea]|uniref:IS200/IS605 family transposase n=1 Tax=Rosenbergiella nectarea TaxID=988801 RepID=UPI0030B8691C
MVTAHGDCSPPLKGEASHFNGCNGHRARFTQASVALTTRPEIDILEMDGEEDHVHILVAYPPKLSVSVLVNNLKSISSRRVRILNTNLQKASNSGVSWSRSYFACSAGGATIETLKSYVISQETPS